MSRAFLHCPTLPHAPSALPPPPQVTALESSQEEVISRVLSETQKDIVKSSSCLRSNHGEEWLAWKKKKKKTLGLAKIMPDSSWPCKDSVKALGNLSFYLPAAPAPSDVNLLSINTLNNKSTELVVRFKGILHWPCLHTFLFPAHA